MNPQCAPFLAQLQGLFDEERVLSREVQDCVDTMLLNPTAEAFEAYMRDSDDSECDSIRELFFFPDETQQYALESFIEAAEFSPEDEKKLMQRLGEMRIEPAFCFPDGRGTVSLMMVPEAAAAFVQRLRITVKIDQRLLRAAESFVRAADCRSVKVRMRNSGLEWTEGRVVFLLDYFEKMRVDNLLPSLDFVIGFLSEIQDQGDMLEHLIKKKKQLFFSLQLASKAAKALEKGTMETLALSRIKIPHVNVGAVKEKMQIIDQITLNLYRTIETLDHVITGTEYDGMDGDIDKVVKALL